MASLVPKMSEDAQKIENVGQLQVTENGTSVKKDDNVPQFDQDLPPPSQYYCTNVPVPQFRKTKESMPNSGAWNNDPAQSEGHTTKFSSGIKVRQTPICRIAPQRWDTTPCNYELVPRIAGNARRLPSVDDYVYGGGTKTSRDPTARKYGKAEPWIIDNYTADSARPLQSINGDAYRRRNSCPAHAEGYTTAFPTQTKELLAFQICPTTSPSRDSTLRNYGRAPLIEDLFADSARHKPPVREDAFGGGFRTKYSQTDNKILVQVSNTGQRYNGASAPKEQKPTHRVNSTVTAHLHEQKTTHRKNPTVGIHQPEQKSTHPVNRTTTVHRPTKKSTDRVNPSANVHPREQKSTRQVNPTVKIKERSLLPEIGVCDEQNFSVYTEDEGKIMNVGEPEAIENEPSINKPDNTPQLDQDSPPQPQTESTNSLKFGKYNERIPLFGECNSDPAEAEGSKTAFSSPKRASRRLNRRITQPSMDTTPIYYEMVPRIADSSWPLPPLPVNGDAYGGWNSNPFQVEGYHIPLACSVDERPISPHSIGRQSKDSTSRNYGRAPLISDLYVADSARPLPSVNEDAYGGGIRTSKDTATDNYGKAPLIRDNFAADTAQPELLLSINEDACGVFKDSKPASTRAKRGAVRNTPFRIYGRAPLIRDIFSNSDRPIPSANEDTYGGGIKISRETTSQNYGKAPLIHDSFVANSALPLPSINENISGRWSSDPSQAEGYTIALPTAQRTSLAIKSECHHTDLPIRDTALLNYGKAPLIEDSFADSGQPLPSVNEETYGGGINTRYDRKVCQSIVQMENASQGNGTSATQVSSPVHPPEVKSTIG